MSKKHHSLTDEDKALSGYIAAMFGSMPVAPPPAAVLPAVAATAKALDVPHPVETESEAAKLANVAKLLAETVDVPAPVAEKPAPVPSVTPAPVVAPPAPAVVTPEPVAVPVPVVAPIPEPAPLVVPPERSVALIPSWGEQRFQTLFFRVGPLTLAVPLSELGGIHALGENITPLFGKPDWFMGLQPYQEGNMQVVDTARWVMPEKYEAVSADGLKYDYVILLANSRWALACSQVHDAVTLEHADIKWRTSLGKRPWLAGVVVEKMCALLDVENFIYLLEHNSTVR